MKPPFKWPGGKRHAVLRLQEYIPQSYGCYYEPFCGAAALFFSLLPNRAVLSDSNREVVNALRVIKERPEELIEALGRLSNSEAQYYAVRSQVSEDVVYMASRFLYLTRLAYNGLYRVNRAGAFNVPYGKRTHLSVFDKDNLLAASLALKDVSLLVADFTQAVERAGNGDVVYFDPPYCAPNSKTFLRYDSMLFNMDDQIRLAVLAQELANRGCTVIVTNSNAPEVRCLYQGFELFEIKRPSSVASDARHRKITSEAVFIHRP